MWETVSDTDRDYETPDEVVELLRDALDDYEVENGNVLQAKAETYREGNYLTSDSGLVLHFPNGAEFQVTVKLSKRPQPQYDDSAAYEQRASYNLDNALYD